MKRPRTPGRIAVFLVETGESRTIPETRVGGLAILEDMPKEYYAALDSSTGTQLDGVSGDRVLGLIVQAMGEDDGAAQHVEAHWPSAAKQVTDLSWPRLTATTRIR